MNLKEHLQLLAMMVPTILLLVAAVFSMAFPGRSVELPKTRPALVADVSGVRTAIAREPMSFVSD